MIMFLILMIGFMIGFMSVCLIGAIAGLPGVERETLYREYAKKYSKIKSVFVSLIASVARYTRKG